MPQAPQEPQEPPQEQELPPCFLFRIPEITIAKNTATTIAATIKVARFMETNLL